MVLRDRVVKVVSWYDNEWGLFRPPGGYGWTREKLVVAVALKLDVWPPLIGT
ncbi:hypothetical protein BH23ACT4_BH23ACT4_12190 [soil metagenome]